MKLRKKREGGDATATATSAADKPTTPSSTELIFMVALSKCMEQYGALLIVFVAIALGFYYVIRAPGFLQQNLEKYFFLLCLPLLLVFFMILRVEYDEALGPVATKVVGMLLLGGVVAWLYTQSNMSYTFSLAMSWMGILLIGLIVLTFVYGYIVAEMRRWKGWLGFFARLLFFVPCLLHDGWQGLMAELRLTHVSIYLAVLLEVALILLYVYMPSITQSVMGADNHRSIVLLNNPVRLNQTKQLTGSPALFDPLNATFRTNYAISMWINLTSFSQQVTGYNKESLIFSYGYQSNEDKVYYVKPMIRYYGGGVSTEATEERNKFVVYASRFPPQTAEEKQSLTYDLTLPAQRWNYVVLNYSHNEMNLFVNGTLAHTFFLTEAMPKYNELDTITVGDVGGVQGGICNVTYYKQTLTPEQIAFSYNVLKDKDPPLMVVAPPPKA